AARPRRPPAPPTRAARPRRPPAPSTAGARAAHRRRHCPRPLPLRRRPERRHPYRRDRLDS
ncbi:hypothetical protein, partial [Dactylosporangium sucinum]